MKIVTFLFWVRFLTLMLAGFPLASVTGLASSLKPTSLRCEYSTNATAIDQSHPRLSWVVEAGKNRGIRQSAYQVLVASDPELLKKGEGDLWDSGKMDSEESVQVFYAGKDLTSSQACFWKVRLWDQEGNTSEWSEAGRWTMGRLKPSDWQAKWISYDGQGEGVAP